MRGEEAVRSVPYVRHRRSHERLEVALQVDAGAICGEIGGDSGKMSGADRRRSAEIRGR